MALPVEPGGAESFAAFFHRWIDHHQAILDQLLPLLAPTSANDDSQLTPIINQVLLHYHNYFDEVSKLAGEDAFLPFSAPWLSPFERAFLWIGGFKPRLVFHLIGGCDLTEDQERHMEELREETGRKEREIEESMAGVHESVAAPPLLGLLRQHARGPLVDGEVSELEAAVVELRKAMRAVMEDANALRGTTVRRLMEVLRPGQAVQFLVAAAEFQLRARRWGLQGSSQKAAGGDN